MGVAVFSENCHQKTSMKSGSWLIINIGGSCLDTSRSENFTEQSQLFTQFAVVSTFHTLQGDIYSQWEIVEKWLSPKWLLCKQTCEITGEYLLVCFQFEKLLLNIDWN